MFHPPYVAQDGKESACSVRDLMITGLGRSPGETNGYHSSILLENSMDRKICQAIYNLESQRVRHN